MKFSNIFACIRVFPISTCCCKLSRRKSDSSTVYFFFGLKIITMRKIAVQLYSSIILVTLIAIVNLISGTYYKYNILTIYIKKLNIRLKLNKFVIYNPVRNDNGIEPTSIQRQFNDFDVDSMSIPLSFLTEELNTVLIYIIYYLSSLFLEPCPTNYTRMGQNCYHFSNRDFDWKSSGSLCRGMGGHLVEFNTVEENQDVIAGIMSNSKFKGNNFWTGGLNPGLLWIWANSARPVQQDTKQTVIGDGRCLKLTFNASSKLYSYRGEDCSSRQRYICELTVEDESANRIERTARLLIDKSD
ncbi:CLC4A protein, partial [Acromyrmex heyeri]